MASIFQQYQTWTYLIKRKYTLNFILIKIKKKFCIFLCVYIFYEGSFQDREFLMISDSGNQVVVGGVPILYQRMHRMNNDLHNWI